MSELLSFPAGRTDDQVDCVGLLGRLLDEMIGGSAPEPQDEPTVNDYGTYGDVEADVENSWRTA